MIDYAGMEWMEVTPDALAGMVREAQEFVQDWLKDRPTSYMPQLLVLTQAGPDAPQQRELFALMVPFNEEADKFALMRRIGRGIHDRQTFPLAAVFSAEAWAGVRAAAAPPMQPRHDPDRREIIVVMGKTLLGLGASSEVSVQRDAEERMTIGPWSEINTSAQSRLLSQLFLGFLEAIKKGMQP